jgi:hypothetical protein
LVLKTTTNNFSAWLVVANQSNTPLCINNHPLFLFNHSIQLSITSRRRQMRLQSREMLVQRLAKHISVRLHRITFLPPLMCKGVAHLDSMQTPVDPLVLSCRVVYARFRDRVGVFVLVDIPTQHHSPTWSRRPRIDEATHLNTSSGIFISNFPDSFSSSPKCSTSWSLHNPKRTSVHVLLAN